MFGIPWGQLFTTVSQRRKNWPSSYRFTQANQRTRPFCPVDSLYPGALSTDLTSGTIIGSGTGPWYGTVLVLGSGTILVLGSGNHSCSSRVGTVPICTNLTYTIPKPSTQQKH